MDKAAAAKIVEESIAALSEEYAVLDDIALYNQEKVLNAFRKNAVQARHFVGSTGYGYDDAGRDTLSQSAVVSPMITAGTQALTLMLFGVLRPGDLFISVSGKPYDTLTDVISGENCGSLKEFGVDFAVIGLKTEGLTPVFDLEAIEKALKSRFVKSRFRGTQPRIRMAQRDIRGADRRNDSVCQKNQPGYAGFGGQLLRRIR